MRNTAYVMAYYGKRNISLPYLLPFSSANMVYMISEKSYYITGLPCNKGERIAGAIRSHWKVENQLHWVFDVNFKRM